MTYDRRRLPQIGSPRQLVRRKELSLAELEQLKKDITLKEANICRIRDQVPADYLASRNKCESLTLLEKQLWAMQALLPREQSLDDDLPF